MKKLPFPSLIDNSGHAKTAFQGASELSQLIAYANDPKHPRKVVITPASGINADNVSHLRELLPLMEEVHLSCGRSVKEEDSDAIRRGVELGFGKGEVWRLDERRLSEFWRVLEGWK